MKTKEEIINNYKIENPKLYKGVEDEVFELNSEEYEAACNEYADIQLEILQKEADALAKKNAAEAKLAALGLTAEDLKYLGI